MPKTSLQAMQWAIWGLLILYSLPLVLLSVSFFSSSQFSRADAILKMFVGLTAASNETLSLLHRSLLPLMGGFAPLAFRDEGTTRASVALMIFLLIGIGLSLFLSAVFSSMPIQENLKIHSLFAIPAGKEQDTAANSAAFAQGIALIQAFLHRTQESMAMYLLMLFGLHIEKATRK